MTNEELQTIKDAALRDEAARLKVINRELLETLEYIAGFHAAPGDSMETATRQIRNTARLAINKSEDSK